MVAMEPQDAPTTQPPPLERRDIKVYLPRELWRQLQARRVLRGEGISATVERALEAYFARGGTQVLRE
jgi:hypothetical protein